MNAKRKLLTLALLVGITKAGEVEVIKTGNKADLADAIGKTDSDKFDAVALGTLKIRQFKTIPADGFAPVEVRYHSLKDGTAKPAKKPAVKVAKKAAKGSGAGLAGFVQTRKFADVVPTTPVQTIGDAPTAPDENAEA